MDLAEEQLRFVAKDSYVQDAVAWLDVQCAEVPDSFSVIGLR